MSRMSATQAHRLPPCRKHRKAPEVIVEDGVGAIIRCPDGCDTAQADDLEAAEAEWKHRNARTLGLF